MLDDPEAALQTANANTQRAISERMGLARNVSPFDWDSLDPDPSSSKPETRSNRPDETAEKERELINEAQEALDRLDFKTAEEICTEVSGHELAAPGIKSFSFYITLLEKRVQI